MFAPSAGGGDLVSGERLRAFKFGWYGDNGLGELLIERILNGKKTASACPAYDPEETSVGEELRIVDKTGKARAKIRITKFETRRYDEIDEALAAHLGSTMEEVRTMTEFANSRAINPDEEMRVTYFELISIF